MKKLIINGTIHCTDLNSTEVVCEIGKLVIADQYEIEVPENRKAYLNVGPDGISIYIPL